MSDNFTPAELTALFADIGQQLEHEPSNKAVLEALTSRAAQTVPGADYAGITIGRSGQTFATVAATDNVVHAVDKIQYDLGRGPGVDAIIENSTLNVADLRVDRRWPEFGKSAYKTAGIVSMLSLRLYVEAEDGATAGLNMYSRTPAAFDESSEAVAVLLAGHGALALGKAAAEAKVANLLVALQNSREIGIAMGILMYQQRITRDQAFNLLRITSQHTHRKVADIATEVADTGALPELPAARPASDTHRS